MELREIYKPIESEINEVEELLAVSLSCASSDSIHQVNRFLLASGGKRIRPALVILSARAASPVTTPESKRQLAQAAATIELIHMASLIHDDLIDRSPRRHNKPTVHSQWGQDVSIVLGDYLYAVAFELISQVSRPDVWRCITSAAKAMCEGELLQVCERDNLDLLKEQYILVVKKKTASLFAASCRIGACLCADQVSSQEALAEYGLNFGIAFQIVDDYLDLVGDERALGKMPGRDLSAGEVTLPVLNLLESVSGEERRELKKWLGSRRDRDVLEQVRLKLAHSGAVEKTKGAVLSYAAQAKAKLDGLCESPFKESLLNLTDFVLERGFNPAPVRDAA